MASEVCKHGTIIDSFIYSECGLKVSTEKEEYMKTVSTTISVDHGLGDLLWLRPRE